MKLTRRTFVAGTATAVIAAPFVQRAWAANPIKVATLFDLSGGLEVNGQPMSQAVQFAAKGINEAGGLLGRPIEIVSYDTQSNMQLYAQYAQQAALTGDTAVVHGGIISASREVIRPILRRYNALYFYNMPYEGGVCDRNMFNVGVTPGHNIEKLVRYNMETHGKRVYIVAADYNYGQIASEWISKFTADLGGTVVGTEFFPLDTANFGSTISKIQAAKPDWVISLLVGGPTISFYRQYAAAGLTQKWPLASTTFTATEAAVLSPAEIEGMTVCQNYIAALDNPQNAAFIKGFEAMFPKAYPVTDLAMASYQGIHLWAEGVRRAKTTDRMAVIEALEGGISLPLPSGGVTIDRKTHHCILNVYLGRYTNGQLSVVQQFPAQAPTDTAAVCDLVANPRDSQQYVIKAK